MTRLHTPLCDTLGTEFPILQAPIGSATSPALAAAVSNAGGLGMLSVTWRSQEEVRRVVRETWRLTERPFGVNSVLRWPQEETLRICLEEGARIVSFFWGEPGGLVKLAKRAGAVVMQSVGSVAEAERAVSAGVDVIVAQGWEAGGHVRGTVSSMALLPRVVDAVPTTPVVAAGGIADGRGVAAALALGAQGVSIGTRFLASPEASVAPLYREHILRAREEDTRYGTIYDVGWPDAPHRVLVNSTVRVWEDAGSPAAGARPGEGEVIARFPDGAPVVRYSDVPPLPGMTGNLEALALYAGQSVGLVTQVRPAAVIVRELVEEAAAALRRASSVLA